MNYIGNKETCAFEVGGNVDNSPELIYVDIWVADKKITLHDNIAFIKAIISSAKYDLQKKRDLNKYLKYFNGFSVDEIHRYIVNTRVHGSKIYGLEGDGLFVEHQVFDWGENTDNVLSFLIQCDGRVYLTIEFLEVGAQYKTGQNPVYSAQIDVEEYKLLLKKFIDQLESPT